MTDIPFNLKKEHRGEYPRGHCAVARCNNQSEVTDDARRIWPFTVPLCAKHWNMKCDWEDEQLEINHR